MRFFIVASLLLGGCVPFPLYQDLQKDLSASKAERNELTKDLEKCEGQKRRTKEQLKDALKATPPPPAPTTMKREELEAIKKRALEETEKNFRKKMEGK